MQELHDGQRVREMFAAGTRWLESNVDAINSLNVFPVPDGDTGTNMLFTMREAMRAVDECDDTSLDAVLQAIARGALMGARGNSGVILSQVLRGFAKGAEGSPNLDGPTLGSALKEASSSAYKAVSNPVEGTMLTVARECSEAAERAAGESPDLEEVLQAAVEGAQESVARTPELLPVLQEAGVVDAGGQGLVTLLEGALKSLRNEPIESAPRLAMSEGIIRLARGTTEEVEKELGFCVQYLIEGRDLDLAAVREGINRVGTSTVVVGDSDTVRVHTHSLEPDAAMEFGESMGSLSRISVENIDDQHADLLLSKQNAQDAAVSIVVVASGDGFKELFAGLGAFAVVDGGQTMNPSTEDLLTAIEAAPAPEVIVLPNNKNIVPAARQAASLSQKAVEVVPTTTVPQGVASVLAFNAELSFADNVAAVKEAFSEVTTLEITNAVRPSRLNGLNIEQGDAIGLLDGKLLASGRSAVEVVASLAKLCDPETSLLATVYYGAQTGSDNVDTIVESLERSLPGIEVETVAGGQPDYEFVISLE